MPVAQRIAPCLWFDHQSFTFNEAQRAMEALLRMKKIDIRSSNAPSLASVYARRNGGRWVTFVPKSCDMAVRGLGPFAASRTSQ
jgi:hypothetical protein